MTASALEFTFIRRFLSHVLPKGYVLIHHFGILANAVRGKKPLRCRKLLETSCAQMLSLDDVVPAFTWDSTADTPGSPRLAICSCRCDACLALEPPGLLPGTWKLDILVPEADRLPREVTVGEDEVVDLVLDLR